MDEQDDVLGDHDNDDSVVDSYDRFAETIVMMVVMAMTVMMNEHV